MPLLNTLPQRAKNPLPQPPDWLTRKNRDYDDRVRDLEAQVKEQKKQDLRTDFETHTQKRIIAGNVKTKVKTLQQANEFNLECRRQK